MDVINLFKENGIKVTKGRVTIFNIIQNSEKSITAEEIYFKCNDCGISINLSTIYRTLELFKENSLIDRFSLGDGKYSFLIKKEEHRHKLECGICHKQIEITCPIKSISESLQNETGFVLLEHKLYLKGVCESCSNSLKNNK